jgi:hypothetical protein
MEKSVSTVHTLALYFLCPFQVFERGMNVSGTPLIVTVRRCGLSFRFTGVDLRAGKRHAYLFTAAVPFVNMHRVTPFSSNARLLPYDVSLQIRLHKSTRIFLPCSASFYQSTFLFLMFLCFFA